ncbi:MAG: PfkB family carbohydrate kinase, partial [Alphaproteobacteria bacterium]
MAPPVVCFGAAHVDRRARAIGAVALATSNPVTVTRGAGGVARNVAETLARLGRSVALVSRVGDDPDGAQVTADLARLGVDVAAVGRSPRRPTASYTALIDPAGELVVALADMAIYDELTADALRPALDRLAGHTVWFLDANLPAGAIAFLLRARPAGATVAVDAVSVAKAARLAGLLDGIDLLFCNRDEAAALSGMAVATPADAAAAADALRRRGARAVVVGCGDAEPDAVGDRPVQAVSV